MEYFSKGHVLSLLSRNSITKKITLADGVSIYDSVKNLPAADVVLNSEVDRLVDKWIGEEKLTQDEKTLRLIEALQDEAKRYERYYFNHEYDKLIAEAEQEVAKKIFEEIDKLTYQLLNDTHYTVGEMIWDINELRKTYIDKDKNL